MAILGFWKLQIQIFSKLKIQIQPNPFEKYPIQSKSKLKNIQIQKISKSKNRFFEVFSFRGGILFIIIETTLFRDHIEANENENSVQNRGEKS